MKLTNKIHPILFCLGISMSVCANAQQAPEFPTQPITWTVPYAPGAATDIIARILSNEMAKDFSQPIVVDYRPGAATILGAGHVAKSQPNGYSIMSADNATLVYNKYIYDSIPYDPIEGFTHIGMMGRFPMALVVNPSLPVNNFQEFIQYAKKPDSNLFYGSPGIGSPHHLNMAYFLDSVGLDMTHVPYKGGAPAAQALLAGDVQVMVFDLVTVLDLIKSGKLKALAFAANSRSPALPDLPTLAEEGVPDMELYAWQGVVGPLGIPEETVKTLNASLNQALQSKAFLERFPDSFEIMPGTPEQFKDFVISENAKWQPFIQKKGITAK